MEAWEVDDKESYQDSKKKAWLITILFNVLVMVGLYFIVVWRPPDPPMAQFGLELNLGFTDVGSGDRQTTTPPSTAQQQAVEAPAPGEVAPKITESTVPKAAPETSTAKPQPSQTQRAIEAQSKTQSPLKGTDKAAESVTPTPKPKESSTPTPQPAEREAERTETKAEEKPTVDPRALFGAGGTSGSGNQPSAGSNQGSGNRAGDEGNPQGTVDGRSILQSGKGNAGDGAGYNLDLAGWDFASKPNIVDNVSTRNGRIVFRITVDDNGKIVQAIPLEYNVSNEVLAYYRTVVNKLSFKRQSGNPTAEYSTGRITFVIKVD